MIEDRAEWIARCAAFLEQKVATLEPSVAYGIAVATWPPEGELSRSGLMIVLETHGVAVELARDAGLTPFD